VNELRAADAYCRVLASRHYENFIVAGPFLSRATRTDLARIYAFCRTTDDLGDESGEDALQRLRRWRDEVVATFSGELPVHPVLFALRETIGRRALTVQPFLDLIAANVQDQQVSSYASWAELDSYCMLSAAPVGRMVLQVFGLTSPLAQRLSDDVCIGLQLANHAQDVSRDAKLGRTYLVASDIAQAGVAGAVERMVARARRLLDSGRNLETMAPPALRMQLALYRLGGLAICDEISALAYRTDVRRPHVSSKKKMQLLASAVAEALRPRAEVGNAATV
jgi:squalene synthase HpnC